MPLLFDHFDRLTPGANRDSNDYFENNREELSRFAILMESLLVEINSLNLFSDVGENKTEAGCDFDDLVVRASIRKGIQSQRDRSSETQLELMSVLHAEITIFYRWQLAMREVWMIFDDSKIGIMILEMNKLARTLYDQICVCSSHWTDR